MISNTTMTPDEIRCEATTIFTLRLRNKTLHDETIDAILQTLSAKAHCDLFQHIWCDQKYNLSAKDRFCYCQDLRYLTGFSVKLKDYSKFLLPSPSLSSSVPPCLLTPTQTTTTNSVPACHHTSRNT
jgi:hypothetical protein